MIYLFLIFLASLLLNIAASTWAFIWLIISNIPAASSWSDIVNIVVIVVMSIVSLLVEYLVYRLLYALWNKSSIVGTTMTILVNMIYPITLILFIGPISGIGVYRMASLVMGLLIISVIFGAALHAFFYIILYHFRRKSKDKKMALKGLVRVDNQYIPKEEAIARGFSFTDPLASARPMMPYPMSGASYPTGMPFRNGAGYQPQQPGPYNMSNQSIPQGMPPMQYATNEAMPSETSVGQAEMSVPENTAQETGEPEGVASSEHVDVGDSEKSL
ncbi:MAG: hypothetical protein Q4P30_00560 [Eubacteriales bacterium]|nr:hypothetical protein [Eubacteriales bacterium]